MPLHNPDEKMNAGQALVLWTGAAVVCLGECIGFFGGYGSAMQKHIGLAVFFLILAILAILVVSPVWFAIFKKARKR